MIARLISDHMALHVIIQTNTSNRLVKLLLGHCYVADPRESQISYIFFIYIKASELKFEN